MKKAIELANKKILNNYKERNVNRSGIGYYFLGKQIYTKKTI